MRHASFERPLAVVTGATSGIGAAYARRLAALGYDLVVTGRRKEKIAELVKELEERHGTQVETILCELSNADHVERLVKRLAEKEYIGVLVNNAGYGLSGAFADHDVDQFVAMVRVHIEATMRITHAVLPGMRQRLRGAIINVSSLASFLPVPESATYSATKAYLNIFTESLHLELRKDGIQVQLLLPGFTHTDFHEQLAERERNREDAATAGSGRFRSRGLVRFMRAEAVVDASLRCLERGRVICIPGMLNRSLAKIAPFVPKKLLYAALAAPRNRDGRRNR